MDLSDLPAAARDRIAAAELEADSIATNSQAQARNLAAEANRRLDPLGIDRILGETPLELDVARRILSEGLESAAGHLFGVTAGEYVKSDNMDFERFKVKLDAIGDWVSQKYGTNRAFLDEVKRTCSAVYLRKRAAALDADQASAHRQASADPEFWQRTAVTFRRLQPKPPTPGEVEHDWHNGLCAWWNPEGWDEGQPYQFINDWHDEVENANILRLFKNAAESAEVELGHAGGEAAVFAWLDRLRLEGLYVKRAPGPPGSVIIHRACDASAEYCLKCESAAKDRARERSAAGVESGAQIAGKFVDPSVTKRIELAPRPDLKNAPSLVKRYKTALGRNVDALRKECGWSFDELAEKTGFDKKNILAHVNDGRTARPITVKLYAEAFTKRLNRVVTVAELEAGSKDHQNTTAAPPSHQ